MGKKKRLVNESKSRKVTLVSVFTWTPRILSALIVFAWLWLLIFSISYLAIGLMIMAILVLTSLIAWKNAPLGGCLFVLLGAGYFLFAMGIMLPLPYVLAVIPLLLTGALFVSSHFYMEKKEEEGNYF
ncbi:MAG: hypothetical protein AABY26_01665 [Nanoarchaeota archaeon]